MTSTCRGLCDVVVVGAGLAGLAAAQALRGALPDLRVLVVEAADYIGGRVKTIHGFGRTMEQSVEAGAEIVHGKNTSLMRLVESLGVRRFPMFTWSQGDGGPHPEHPVDGGVGYYYLGGTERRLLPHDSRDPEFVKVNGLLSSLCEIDLAQLTPEQRGMSLLDYLRSKDVSPMMLSMAEAGYANTQCGNLRDFSLVNVIKAEQAWENDGMYEVRVEAMQSLACALRGDLPVWLNWPVTRIDYTGEGGAELDHTHDAENAHNHGRYGRLREVCKEEQPKEASHPVRVWHDSECVQARFVIVTVPIPVLQEEDICFRPPLPEWKLDAAWRCTMEPALKVILRFRKPFWPKDMHGVICADSLYPEFWPALSSSDDTGILVCFCCADYARDVSNMSRHELHTSILAQLDDMFGAGSASDNFIDLTVYDWAEMPYVRGGYVCPSRTVVAGDWEHLQRPLNKQVYFAGEAVSPGGCMHGAVDSGVWAADAILQELGHQPSLFLKSKL